MNMNFEQLQQHWQQQEERAPAMVDASLVLQEVRRNQRSFETMIFWRDFREVAVAMVIAPYFALRGPDWTYHLMAAAAAGVGLYLLVDRLRQRKFRPSQSASLRTFVEQSLHEVRHQVWLLRNVLWWYLLPLTIPMLISMAVSADNFQQGLRGSVIACLLTFLIYRLNQSAVTKSLVPRVHELENLLAGISEPPTDDSTSHSSVKASDERCP